MDLLPTGEQQQIVDAVRDVLAGRFTAEQRRQGGGTLDDATWRDLAGLGWLALALPEVVGGSGLALAEETLLCRELGRSLVPPSLVATILAGHLAMRADAPALARQVASGAVRVAFAVEPPRFADARAETYLLDDAGATHALVVDARGAALVPVEVGRRHLACLDESLGLGAQHLDRRAAVAANGGPSIGRHLRVLMASMLVGVAEGARDLAVSHAQTRQQFGQPIGAFQAVKHRCADMAIRAECAWFQAVFAGLAVQDGAEDAGVQSAAAMSVARQAAVTNAEVGVQVHGAMGFSSECDAHRYVKRACALSLVGPPSSLLDERLLSGAAA